MIRLLHIGDIHLDSPFQSKDTRIRETMRVAIREAFERAVDYSIDMGVHGILIAGDLFDNDTLSFATESFLRSALLKLKGHGIQVFYTTGNHDPGEWVMSNSRLKSIDNLHIMWDDKVTVLDKTLNNHQCKIIGVGHKTKGETRNLIKDFPVSDGSMPHVGIVHAMISGVHRDSQLHDNYLPTTLEELNNKGYQYWALGHIHKRGMVMEQDNIMYSGNIQGRSFKELGEKGGLLVDIYDDYIETRFIELGGYVWEEISIHNIDAENYDQLVKMLIVESKRFLVEKNLSPDKTLLRMSLSGKSKLVRELQNEENINYLAQEIAEQTGLFYCEIKDKGLIMDYDMDNSIEDNPFIKYMMKKLDELIAADSGSEIMEELMDMDVLTNDVISSKDKKKFILEILDRERDNMVSMFMEEAQ